MFGLRIFGHFTFQKISLFENFLKKVNEKARKHHTRDPRYICREVVRRAAAQQYNTYGRKPYSEVC